MFEPGLDQLILAQISAGRLRFTTDPHEAVKSCDVLWVTFDTPVDDDDNADPAYVLDRIKDVLPLLDENCVVLISSQLPVGSCRKLERDWDAESRGRKLGFAYSPENLRLGKAIDVFRNPDRVVVGVRNEHDRQVIASVLQPITDRIEWMSVESAEMTKHALNAFLALSVSYANEIAALCERVGADAKEVERGLKTEVRIGPGAYLSPGTAFAGGTLARDVAFLNRVAQEKSVQTALLSAIRASNDNHRSWPQRKLQEAVGQLAGKTVAILGLTYKPGTDTLRRSNALELCHWLLSQGANVRAYDPVVHAPQQELTDIHLCQSAEDAANGADALVLMTGWPQFRDLPMESMLRSMKGPNILDPSRVLPTSVSDIVGLRYFAVGTAPGTAS
jgi:UDPglucose 6-dehydrogenase